MATPYQTKITKARFIVSPYTAQEMASFGQSIIDSNFARWDRGIDANDGPAPPLSFRIRTRGGKEFRGAGREVGYRAQKRKFGKQPIRDLNLTGQLRRSINVLEASENRAVMGPIDGIHTGQTSSIRTRIVKNALTFADVLRINQRRWRMWGVSPSDNRLLRAIMRPFIKAKAA